MLAGERIYGVTLRQARSSTYSGRC